MNETTKKCPMCAEEIKAEARICRYCKARFEVTIKGYCSHDHQVVEADKQGNCPICQGELVDLRVDSRLLGGPAPAQTPAAASVPPAPTARPIATAVPVAAAPAAAVAASGVTRVRMPFWQIYLSPSGRIGRQTFFLKGVLPVLGVLILSALIFLKVVDSVDASAPVATDAVMATGLVVISVEMLFLYWVLLMLLIKRFHDLGRSGWNILLWLIPLAGQFINLWNWIEFLFVKGTDGPNKFGGWTD